MSCSDDETLALVKGAIYDLSPEQQTAVRSCAQNIRTAVSEAGELGMVALALVGGEAAVVAGLG